MSIKAQLEALIYAAEDPITLDQMAALLKDDLLALKTALEATPQLPQEFQAQDVAGSGFAGSRFATLGRAGAGKC